jgi:hypothetical protein
MVYKSACPVFARSTLARIPVGVLGSGKRAGWSFQLSMKAPAGPVSSRTEVNESRRMASRVMIEKKHSTRFGEAFVVPAVGPEAEADPRGDKQPVAAGDERLEDVEEDRWRSPNYRTGARNSVTSCDLGVFVEETAEPVAPDD